MSRGNVVGALTIALERAEHLPSKDFGGYSDPYCVFEYGGQRASSCVVYKTLDPTWNDTLNLFVEDLGSKGDLVVVVKDRDVVNDDILGSFSVEVSDLMEGEVRDVVRAVGKGKVFMKVIYREFRDATTEEVETGAVSDDSDSDLEEEVHLALKLANRKVAAGPRDNDGENSPKSRGRSHRWSVTAINNQPANPGRGLVVSREFLYGGNFWSCRDNVHFSSNKHIVFNAASLAVVHRTKEHSQTFFDRHRSQITCLVPHPNKRLFASADIGPLHPTVYVWDSESLNVVFAKTLVNQESISAMAFSPGDGDYLVTCGTDPGNTICVWSAYDGRQISALKGMCDKNLAVAWRSPSEFVTCGVRHVTFWEFSGNRLKVKSGVFGNIGSIHTQLCICFLGSDVTITGSSKGHLYVWKQHRLHKVVLGTHSRAVTALSSLADGKSFVSASKDGLVKEWKAEEWPLGSNIHIPESEQKILADTHGEPIRAMSKLKDGSKHKTRLLGTSSGAVHALVDEKLMCLLPGHFPGHSFPHPARHGDSTNRKVGVCAIAVHPSDSVIATGGDDRTVRLWDVVKRKPYRVPWHASDIQFEDGTALNAPITALAFKPDGRHIGVGFLDGHWCIIDFRTSLVVASGSVRSRRGTNGCVNVLKWSPKCDYLAVASQDRMLYLYDGNSYANDSMRICIGHASGVTSIMWSEDGSAIASAADGNEILYFSAEHAAQIEDGPALETLKWEPWSLPCGPCLGSLNGSPDITAVLQSLDREHIAAATDRGVEVYPFPIGHETPSASVRGHCAPIGGLAWVNDSRDARGVMRLISVGSHDHSIIQWRVEHDHNHNSGHNTDRSQH